jgi:hypothetical protein
MERADGQRDKDNRKKCEADLNQVGRERKTQRRNSTRLKLELLDGQKFQNGVIALGYAVRG